ncbi:CUE domain-containing protein [Aphelenchoides fujianensis]|nr:CUE domain-containing protein [Aphelenchoides fujianensis]
MNQENNAPAHSLVDFNTAMENFKTMFPQVSAERIEVALRRNDGDVARSVDELLASAAATTTDGPPKPRVDLSKRTPSVASSSNCENDEKIALDAAEPRVPLRYLRSNQDFMRELGSDHYGAGSSSRRHESVLSRCKRNSAAWATHEPPSTSSVGMDTTRVPLPDGPMVDPCDKPLSRLSRKIKSKLPMRDSAIPRPEDMYEHTVSVDYGPNDEHFVQKLKNMSKSISKHVHESRPPLHCQQSIRN